MIVVTIYFILKDIEEIIYVINFAVSFMLVLKFFKAIVKQFQNTSKIVNFFKVKNKNEHSQSLKS